jgi:DNA-dependent RNA polymerase auxiliary subunit epsilon
VLLFLVNDRQPVRCNIAKNLNSSHEVLDILSKDKDENVRSLVLRNANLRIETFIALFDKTYPSWEKGGDKTFLKSARDYMIVLNNNTSRETIEKALVNAISIDERKATRSPFISHHSKNDIIGAGIGHKNFNLDFIDELKSKTADERLLFSIDLGAINSDQCTKVLYEQASQRYIERSRRKIYLSHGTVDEIVEFIECTFAQKHPEDARSVLSRWRLGLQKIKEIYFKDYIHHDEDDHTTEEEVLRDMHEEHPHLKTLFREDIVSDSLLRQYIKVLLN